MHLVGFVIRIYHDARSPEIQTTYNIYLVFHGLDYIYLKNLTNCNIYESDLKPKIYTGSASESGDLATAFFYL